MKNLLTVLIIIVLSAIPGRANELSIFGYFQSDYTKTEMPDESFQLQTNKLRVDFQKEISGNCSFGANINYFHYSGKIEYDIFDYIPEKFEIPDFEIPFRYEDKYELDNLFAKLNFGKFDLTVGKQQISPGTGYALNPTDIFNQKDILDPTYEQKGHNAIRLDFAPTLSTNVSLIYSPEEDFKHSKKMAIVKQQAGHFDISFSGSQAYWTHTSIDPEYSQDTFERNTLGLSIVGELWGPGIWLEFAENFTEDRKDFTEFAAGLDYTFDSELFVMIEYFYKSDGKEDKKDYSLSNWIQYYNSEVLGFIRHQVYGYFSYPFTDLITIGQSTVFSPGDGSALFIPEIRYSAFTDVELTVRGIIYAGDEEACFSKNGGNSLFLRALIYW